MPALRALPLLLLISACGPHRYQGLEPAVSSAHTSAERPRADARAWFLRARVASARGDDEEAERAWTWALRLHPGSAWLHVAHGDWLLDQDRVQEAGQSYERALETDPASAHAQEALGLYLLDQGEPGRAELLLLGATGQEASPWAWWGLVEARRQLSDELGALEALRAWTARPPVSAEEGWLRAQTALELDLPGTAVEDLVRILEQRDAPVTAAEELVLAAQRSCRVGTALDWAWSERAWLLEGGDWSAAVRDIALSAGDADLLGEVAPEAMRLERARLLAGQGRAQEALDLLRTGRTAPPPAEERLEEGHILHQLGRLEPALAAWERVPLEDPLGPRAVVLRVEVLLEQGRAASALRLAQDTQQLLPEQSQLRWALALALQGSGQVSEAEALVEPGRLLARLRLERQDLEGAVQALREGGMEDARTPAELARLLERLGRDDQAHQAWLTALERDRDDPAAWMGVARTDPEQAPGALREALRADPCYVPALLESARRASGPAELGYLERAVDASPLDIRSLEALARAAEAQGQPSLARQLRARARRVSPETR